jgi:menaquinone-dependent protoporphyrinogen IX oxidase
LPHGEIRMILYESKTMGVTRWVWISEGMGGIADVFDVRENRDLKGFDHIIIGGSIRSGAARKELQDYIIKNKGMLKDKIRALFAVWGNREKPVGPEQKTALMIIIWPNCAGLEICHQRFLMAELQNR